MLNTIKARILVGYASILLVTLLVAAVLTVNNSKVSTQVDAYVIDTLPMLEKIDAVQQKSKELVLISYSLYGTTLSSDAFAPLQRTLIEDIDTTLPRISVNNELVAHFGQLTTVISALRVTMSSDAISWDMARDNLQAITVAADAFQEVLFKERKAVAMAATARANRIADQMNTSQHIIYVLVAVLASVVLFGWLLSKKQIAAPISALASQLNEVAESRNLVATFPHQQTLELENMRRSMAGLLDVFRNGMVKVHGAVEQIDGAALVLTESTQHSSASITELKTEITTLVVRMDSLSADMEQSLLRSQFAATSAKESAIKIDEGQSQVQQSASAISDLAKDIEQTSCTLETLQSEGAHVSGVVKTIADIAAQTNLLALNAAIEAARAGESGRGFAVVADEVRTLAVRTHQSTVEINTMLERIVSSIQGAVDTMSSNRDKANASVHLANEVVTTLEEGRRSMLSLVDVSEDAASLASTAQEKERDAKAQVSYFEKLGEKIDKTNKDVAVAASDLSQLSSALSDNANHFTLS